MESTVTDDMIIYKLSTNIRVMVLRDGSGANIVDMFQGKSVAILPDEFANMAYIFEHAALLPVLGE